MVNLVAAQTKSTKNTMNNIIWILNYAATHLDTAVTYDAGDMRLKVYSDASYLLAPKARSRAAVLEWKATRG